MTLSIKNNGYVFLLRLDLMFSISLFRTILSFCSVFTRDFSCAMSWKYEQCWQLQQPIITEKLTGPKKKICGKVMFRRHCTGFYLVQCCLESLGQHCTRFLAVQCCPKSIKTSLNKISSCTLLSGASWTTLLKVFTFVMLAHG